MKSLIIFFLMFPLSCRGKILRFTWHCDVTPPPPSNQSLPYSPPKHLVRFSAALKIRQTHWQCFKTGFREPCYVLPRCYCYTHFCLLADMQICLLTQVVFRKPEVLEFERETHLSDIKNSSTYI